MLWSDEIAAADARPRPNEGRDLPAEAGETWEAAWGYAEQFSQSSALAGDRAQALDGFRREVEAAGGDVNGEYARQSGIGVDGEPLIPNSMDVINTALAKARANNPAAAQILPMSDDELNRRADQIRTGASLTYAQMADREKTFGGRVGFAAGTLAGGAADPLNLPAMAIAPEMEIGVLGTALLWGAYSGASQAANEALNPGRAAIQPGYSPVGEVASATAGGAVLGGGFRGLGNLWSRVKTGYWPTSVRDAGNVVESEANIASTNVLPGAEGEAAHRGALTKAIDDIIAQRPVEPGRQLDTFAPRLEDELNGALTSRTEAQSLAEQAATERAALPPSGELPFQPLPSEVAAQAKAGAFAENIQRFARVVGHDMPDEQAAALASRIMAAGSDDEARAILGEIPHRPVTLPDTAPSAADYAKAVQSIEQEPAEVANYDALRQMTTGPKGQAALQASIERTLDERAAAGKSVNVPVGVDENGAPVYRTMASALDDIAQDKEAAQHLENCLTPMSEAAE